MSLEELFEDVDKLLGPDGQEVELKSLMGDGKVIGLYFSAHWCPPCRGFTPNLTRWYDDFKKTPNGDKFGIIFVSSDKNSDEFKDYFEEMTWFALPYSLRTVKEKLSKTFKVSGIPTLVFLDGNTGEMITKDGRTIIMEDPKGLDFPWVQKDITELLPGKLLKDTMESTIEWSELTEEVIGLYFSAHWCGPCQTFTPQLIKTYKKVRESGKSFEVIFISSDREESDMHDYFRTMPWLAVPFGDVRKKKISHLFGISGIPSLVIMRKNGEIISTKGRSAVLDDPEGEWFPWAPRAVNPLNSNTASDINEYPCLIWFVETAQESKNACQILSTVAETHISEIKKGDTQVYFFYDVVNEDDGIGESLRQFANIPQNNPLLALIDINSQKVFVLLDSEDNPKPPTKEDIQVVLSDFLRDDLTMTDLHQ